MLILKRKGRNGTGLEGRRSIQLSYGHRGRGAGVSGFFRTSPLNIFPALHSETASASHRAAFYAGGAGGAR